jgi:hypothetical protein
MSYTPVDGVVGPQAFDAAKPSAVLVDALKTKDVDSSGKRGFVPGCGCVPPAGPYNQGTLRRVTDECFALVRLRPGEGTTWWRC